MNWRDFFGSSMDFKAVSISPPPAVDPAALRPLNLDLPANLPPYWPGPDHAEVHWPFWGDEWVQLWFNRGIDYERSSLVMDPVNWLMRQLCDAPPKLEHLEDGNWVNIPDHPYLDFMDQPSQYFSVEDFFKDFAFWWITDGNVYWYKIRDRAGRLLELFPLSSDQVRPATIPGSGDFISYYECTENENYLATVPRRVPPENMVHFRFALDPHDRRVSRNPLKPLTLELAADQEAIAYSAAVMKNFGVPPFLVSPKPVPSEAYTMKAEAMKDEITRSTTGSKRGQPLVFSRPMDITPFGFSPDQMAIDKMRRLPEERVAGVLGIPGLVLQFGSFLDRSTYNNMESAVQLAWNAFVIPTYKDISSTLRRSLMPEFVDDPMAWWPGFDYSQSPAMSEDTNELFVRCTQGYKEGWLKRSEVRADAGYAVDEAEDNTYKPTPSGGGFGFGSLADGEQKGFPLEFPDPVEVEETKRFWRRFAPPEAQGLLTAREVG